MPLSASAAELSKLEWQNIEKKARGNRYNSKVTQQKIIGCHKVNDRNCTLRSQKKLLW